MEKVNQVFTKTETILSGKNKKGRINFNISAAIICPLLAVSNHIPLTSFYSLTSEMPEILFFLEWKCPPKLLFPQELSLEKPF